MPTDEAWTTLSTWQSSSWIAGSTSPYYALYDRNSGNNRKIANVIHGLKLGVKPSLTKKSEDNKQDTQQAREARAAYLEQERIRREDEEQKRHSMLNNMTIYTPSLFSIAISHPLIFSFRVSGFIEFYH